MKNTAFHVFLVHMGGAKIQKEARKHAETSLYIAQTHRPPTNNDKQSISYS
jgi:hypothetical protein